MLTLAEEILLLVLDDETGKLQNLPVHSLNTAVGGALLMDLALRHRLDADLEQLIVVDRAPVGEPILDGVLTRVADAPAPGTSDHWVDLLAREGHDFRERLLGRLIERGILARKGGRLRWALGVRRYPLTDDKAQRDVKRRISGILLSDDIPDPRDVVIVALADACTILDGMFSESQMKAIRPRIDQVAKMDLIGQAVTRTMRALQDAARGAEAKWFS